MKVQRYRYSFRSRNGYCFFEGFFPQLSDTRNDNENSREAAVNRLLMHLWRPDERTACKGTAVANYREFTDFRATYSSVTLLSLRFEVRGQFDGSREVERRVEGFTVDLAHARELLPFHRVDYDALLELARRTSPDAPPPRTTSRKSASESPQRPHGFYVKPSGLVLIVGGNTEMHVAWEHLNEFTARIPALRDIPRKQAPPA